MTTTNAICGIAPVFRWLSPALSRRANSTTSTAFARGSTTGWPHKRLCERQWGEASPTTADLQLRKRCKISVSTTELTRAAPASSPTLPPAQAIPPNLNHREVKRSRTTALSPEQNTGPPSEVDARSHAVTPTGSALLLTSSISFKSKRPRHSLPTLLRSPAAGPLSPEPVGDPSCSTTATSIQAAPIHKSLFAQTRPRELEPRCLSAVSATEATEPWQLLGDAIGPWEGRRAEDVRWAFLSPTQVSFYLKDGNSPGGHSVTECGHCRVRWSSYMRTLFDAELC